MSTLQMLAVTLALVQSSGGAEDEAVMQARTLHKKGKLIARGITVEVPQDNQGLRYFCSETQVLSGAQPTGWSTVASWTTQDGTPVLAVYKAQVGRRVQEIRFKYSAGQVEITDTERGNKPVVFKVPEDSTVIISDLNPANIPEINLEIKELIVFAPDRQVPTTYVLKEDGIEKVLMQGELIDTLRRFQMQAPGNRALIKTDLSGRFRYYEDSGGKVMQVVEMTEEERVRASRLVSEATAK